MARTDFATVRRRARQHDAGVMNCNQLADLLEAKAPARWERWAGWYGPLAGTWIGGVKTSGEKLSLLVLTVLGLLVEEVNRAWTLDFDRDGDDRPTGLLISSATDSKLIRLEITSRRIKIGGEEISLASRTAGSRILRILSSEIGGFLGGSRVLH